MSSAQREKLRIVARIAGGRAQQAAKPARTEAMSERTLGPSCWLRGVVAQDGDATRLTRSGLIPSLPLDLYGSGSAERVGRSNGGCVAERAAPSRGGSGGGGGSDAAVGARACGSR
jgi:hypothetical protein